MFASINHEVQTVVVQQTLPHASYYRRASGLVLKQLNKLQKLFVQLPQISTTNMKTMSTPFNGRTDFHHAIL